MSVASTTLLEKIYKIRYSPDGLTEYLEKESDLIAWLPKKTDFGGWKWWKTFKTNAVRGSTTFGTALANKNVPSFKRAEIHRAQDHVIVSVNCEAARAAKNGGEYALVDELDDAIKSSMEEMAMSIENMLVGDGGGSRAQASNVSTDTITLADPSKIYLFHEGMKLQFSANNGTDSSHALRDGGATAEIAAIDQAAGTITCTANVSSTVPSVGSTDYIFREGDFDDGAQRVLQGFFAWVPASAPTSGDSFFGVDRSDNVGALAGMRIDGAGANPFTTVKEAGALVKRNRGKADTLWVNPTKYAELDEYITSKQYFTQEMKPGIGVSGFRIHTVAGLVNVMASSAFPEGIGLLTRRECWLLRALDGFPHPVDDDGRIWHLESAADALQARHRYYAQLGHLRPQDSCHITF